MRGIASPALARALTVRCGVNPPIRGLSVPYPFQRARKLLVRPLALAKDVPCIKTHAMSSLSTRASASVDGATGLAQQQGQVVIIAGPTAVGKTAVALELAELLGGEIINADSVQVYRGLDVGSAKITKEEMRGIPHHLLDVLPPTESFNAGDFCEAAWEIAAEILARNKVPIVVGGNGLYLKWFVNGKPGTPGVSSSTRNKAREAVALARGEAAARGASELEQWEAALQLLVDAGDPATAAQLNANDFYRLSRALEILYDSGQARENFVVPGSVHVEQPPQGKDEDNGGKRPDSPPGVPPPAYDYRCFFLYSERIKLYRRIDLRCEQMAAGGMMTEAQWMLSLGLTPGSVPSSSSIGYRQAMEYLQDCAHSREALEKEFLTFLTEFQQATRQYTTRQLTWFRGDKAYEWVEVPEGEGATHKASAHIARRLALPSPEPSSGGEGRLNKEQQREMKRYRPEQTVFSGEAPIVKLVATLVKS